MFILCEVTHSTNEPSNNQDLADEIAELHNTLGAPIRQPKKAPAKKKRGKK